LYKAERWVVIVGTDAILISEHVVVLKHRWSRTCSHDVPSGVVQEDAGCGLKLDRSLLAPARSVHDAQSQDDVWHLFEPHFVDFIDVCVRGTSCAFTADTVCTLR
jgi:hypothetical protein